MAKRKQKQQAVDPHVAKGLEYCRQVVAGAIPACKYVRAACQRQLNDCERAKSDPTWRFRFDEARAGRAARFLEQLPHVKGPKAGQLFQLEPWQCFIVTTVFGWVRKDTGARRFRRAYAEVPRGNGKSFLSSGIALYALAADGEAGAEVYSAATTTSQAKITYGDAEAMLRKRPALLETLGLKISAHAIYQRSTNSTFGALSREAKNHDGKNIHVAVVDELHAHPTRAVWDVLITGAAKRPQSLIWTITTAGFDTSGICYEVRDGVVKMLEGAENEALFGIIYTVDEGDDWRSEASWIKANPNWNASIDHDTYRLTATEALQTASKENNFKTKHLNVWCNADVAWMQMAAWDACGDPELREEDFAREPCTLGLDLASKIDLAIRSKLFHRDLEVGKNPDGSALLERHFYLFVQSYLPERAVQESKNAQYEGWAKDGWITVTPGDVLDFGAIKGDVLGDQSRNNLREVAFDPWQATQLANELQDKAVVMVEVRPTVQNFSEPMKQWEALVLQRRFHHDGNPAMRWMVSNVVCHRDAKDNVYPRKTRPENKIDGPVATIMALNRALLAPPQERSYLESSELVVLG
jgi:phage terminase large subunit-like protein